MSDKKEKFVPPKITRIDLADTEVASMAVAAKAEEPLVNNPCAVGGVGGPLGTPLPGGFGS